MVTVRLPSSALMIVVAVTTTAPATQIGQDSGGGE